MESNNDDVSDEKVDSTSAVIMAKQDKNVDAEDHIEEELKGDTVLTDETSDLDSESSSYSQTGSDSESSSESGELTTESSSSDVEMTEIEHPPVVYEPTTGPIYCKIVLFINCFLFVFRIYCLGLEQIIAR